MTVMPMNPQSVLFPEAPSEFTTRLPYAPPPNAGREAVRDAYQSHKIGYDRALEALHRLGMSWFVADCYLLVPGYEP